MPHEIINSSKTKMNNSIEAMQKDFSALRAGRANAKLLDRVMVDYYGSQTPLNQLANISIPDPKVLQVTPYDASALKEIEKAILKSDIGINPNNDGKAIRLNFPDLTQERRKELTKGVSKRSEEAKVSIRNIRRDANDLIKKERKDNTISEDDQKSLEMEIQKLTDKYIKDIDKLAAEKEKEILSV